MPQFRALRESLLSNSAPLPFFTAALEASSDACLRAGSFPEFLKSAQQLVLVSYPALAAEHQVGQLTHAITHGLPAWKAATTFWLCCKPGHRLGKGICCESASELPVLEMMLHASP